MAAPPTETRRDLDSAATSHRGDRIFNRGITVAAFTALLVLAGIAIFLGIAAAPAVGGIPDDEIFDLAASKIILQEDQPVVGWPILGTGHLLVCDDAADPLPLSVAQYSLRLAGEGALETYGLTPLPEPVRIKTFEPLKVTVAGEN